MNRYMIMLLLLVAHGYAAGCEESVVTRLSTMAARCSGAERRFEVEIILDRIESLASMASGRQAIYDRLSEISAKLLNGGIDSYDEKWLFVTIRGLVMAHRKDKGKDYFAEFESNALFEADIMSEPNSPRL